MAPNHASNNLTQMSGLDNYGITYVYGKDNRLLQAADKSYHYDENGRVFKTVAPDNIQSISYYPNGWCQNIRDSKFPGQYDFKYNYYNNGNISSINSWVGTENFTYDGMGRITNWSLTPRSGNAIQKTYSYDAAGNLLTKGANSYTYNAANQITSAGFTYDNNGNLTADGTYRYTYNAENQLIEVRRAADNSLVASYTYNFNGLRKSKTVNGVTTNFYYDKNGNLVKDSNNSFYYYDPNGKLLSLITGGYYYAVHSNARGDVVSIVGNNATTQYQYDPWGKIISTSGPANQPFRYAGYYYDEETGLYYLKSRYYSPTLGRFLTTDARSYINVGNPQTLNLYSYCNNNPINFVDPSGCEEVEIDDNEYEYLTNMVDSDPDPGNREWAQYMLDTYFSGYTLANGESGGNAKAALGIAATAIVGDDVTGVGVADDWLLVVVGVGGLIYLAKESGKEKANDVPSWARGNRPNPGENGNDFANRLCDEKYGPGNYQKGPGSEHNKIRKWGDRGFNEN